MDVKEAVAIAIAHVAELFAQEKIANLGLEAVEFVSSDGVWDVTVGFTRPWDTTSNPFLLQGIGAQRTYKTVRIQDDTKKVQSIKIWQPAR